jgi:hypothetical protein
MFGTDATKTNRDHQCRRPRGRGIALVGAVASMMAAGALIIGGFTTIADGSSGSEPEGACPATKANPPSGSFRKSRRLLVPRVKIREVLACRYEGERISTTPEVKPGSLAAEANLSSTQGMSIARALDNLRPVKMEDLGCPIDLGGRVYLIFGLWSGESLNVIVHLSGCRLVESPPGASHQFYLTPKLQDKLEMITGR